MPGSPPEGDDLLGTVSTFPYGSHTSTLDHYNKKNLGLTLSLTRTNLISY